MKKVLSLSAVVMAAATVAMAEPSVKVDMSKAKLSNQEVHQLLQARKAGHRAQASKANKRFGIQAVNGQVQVRQLQGNAFMAPKTSFKLDPKSAKLVDPQKNVAAPTSSATNAYYRPSDGIFANCEVWTSQEELIEIVGQGGLAGLDPSQYPNGTYLTYNVPNLFAQSLNTEAGFQRVAGKTWKVNGHSLAELEVELADPDFFGLTEVYGAMMGGYYIPSISTGRNSYLYGSDAEGGLPGDPAIFGANIGEPQSMGVYNGFDGTVYTGFTNTYGFGSRNYISQDGYEVSSDVTYIDLGKVGDGMVIDFIDMMCVSDSDSPVSGDPEEGNYIGATLVDIDANGEATYYRTILAEGDERILKLGNFSSGEGFYSVHINFTDIDEDGFETEVMPVLHGEAYLMLYNFRCPNVDLGIYMTYNDNADKDGNLDNQTRSYYDVYLDGEPKLDEDGYAMLSGDDRLDAVVNFNAYFNCFVDVYGKNEVTVTAPVEGGYAVSLIDEDGTAYNDIDVYTTFGVDDIEIIECPDWMIDEEGQVMIGVDDSYFENSESSNISNVLMFFVAAPELPAGVEGRQGQVKLLSHNEVEFTINVVQGNATQSLNGIKNDAAKAAIFNLQGVKVGQDLQSLPAGVYVQNGRKVVK